MHGMLTSAKADQLRQMRTSADIYVDTGDVIKAGNLAIPLRPEQAWALLAEAGCDLSVPGNRESHILRSAVEAKVRGHTHQILCANWHAKDGVDPFPSSTILELKGLRVGFFGVMVPIVTTRMTTAVASQFLWEAPIPCAMRTAAELRPQVDVVIALTHIGFAQDKLLAEASSQIDIIFGGHSHTVLVQPLRWGTTWIAQGGSHARFAGEYEWDGQELTGQLTPLG